MAINGADCLWRAGEIESDLVGARIHRAGDVQAQTEPVPELVKASGKEVNMCRDVGSGYWTR